MQADSSRRNFIKTTAAAAITAPGILRAQNASSTVRIGWIGVGSRGYYLMERLYAGSKDLAQVTAVCDTYTQHLSRAKDRVQTMGGNSPKTYEDYLELLQDPNVDAVVISTPEHLHYPMFMAALKAGKNIYVEKPLAHTIEEGELMVQAAEQSGKVVQVGTQNRSNSLYQQAKQMVADGMIGDIHYVRAFWYRNSLDDNPAWRYKIPDDATPQNSDWNKFLGAGAQTRMGPAPLFPVAPVLGLLRRHRNRPAGASDRHHQLRLRTSGPGFVHGVRRNLPLDRRRRRSRYAGHFQRDLRVSR